MTSIIHTADTNRIGELLSQSPALPALLPIRARCLGPPTVPDEAPQKGAV